MSKILFLPILCVVLNTAAQIKIDQSATTLSGRFFPPIGYKRQTTEPNSFSHYLRHLPLKPWNSLVLYFDGQTKNTPNVYVSVVDLSIGKRDLHQCADAVMRLRAEYLYAQRRFDEIHFNFVADGKPRFFKNYTKGDYSYQKFWKYMEYIFISANTRSLQDELKPIAMSKMQVGDVFIQKGIPFGHAVIVVDMAENTATGQKVYLLAQSYMPAQEIQLLANPQNNSLSPWYELRNETITTPEWTFEPADLHRFTSH